MHFGNFNEQTLCNVVAEFRPRLTKGATDSDERYNLEAITAASRASTTIFLSVLLSRERERGWTNETREDWSRENATGKVWVRDICSVFN